MKKSYLIGIGIIGFILVVVVASRMSGREDTNNVFGDDAVKTDASVLIPKANDEGMVTVAVTPIDQSDWSFEISLNTHSVDIGEDLTQVSVLIDEKGNEHKPISWQGDPPGGHHLKGVLYFGEITPLPRSIVLIIREIGGIDERKFEWTLP